MKPDEPRKPAKRPRETVRDEDVMRSSREIAARRGVREEDVMRSARELARMRGEDVAPPSDMPRGMRGRGPRARGRLAGPPAATPPASPHTPAPSPHMPAPFSRHLASLPAHAPPTSGLPSPPPPPAPAEPVVWSAPDEAPVVWQAPADMSRPSVATVPWDDIVAAATGFDPLAITGGIDRAIALSHRMRGEFASRGFFTAEPIMVGACLAFECRSYRHCGIVPEGDDLRYMSALYHSLQQGTSSL